MNRVFVVFLVAFAVASHSFKLPSGLPNRFASKKLVSFRGKVAPQLLSRDYKGSLANYPITLDTPTLPARVNYGPHILVAVVAILAARNLNLLKELVLQTPDFLRGLFRSNGGRGWSLDLRKLFSKASLTGSWNKCILQSKSSLSDKYVRYRFEADSALLSSSMSQVQLCSGGSKKDAVVETFCCLNYPSQGYFEIVEEIRPESDDLGSSSSSSFLSRLSGGDEVAFKPKEATLKLSPSQKSFFVMTVGLGIVPTLQVMLQILTQSNADVYLVWANSNKGDFIYNKYVKDVEDAFPQRLTVSRLVDDSVDNTQSAGYSERLKKCVLSYELGRVGTIFAPAREVQKAKKVLRELNYPESAVLACEA